MVTDPMTLIYEGKELEIYHEDESPCTPSIISDQ